jgi:predicted alpha/beta-fold hydrolase
MRPFEPLFRNPHVATITANFWPREYDFSPYPMERRLIQTDADTQVLVQTQHPVGEPVGEVVLLHGLEGGGDAGYCISTAYHALQRGFVAHRFHMRTCGGTESLCKTLYHAGLTSDLRVFLEQNATEGRQLPVFLIGYSLGGNVGLKLTGELGETDLIAGTCAISTPIDLGASAKRIGDPINYIYERRFVKRMKKRLLATGRFKPETLAPLRSIFDIDDKITAPSFGFRDAEHYYATQSAKVFLRDIRVPTLLVQARDDSYIPFEIFSDPAIAANPMIDLLVTEHGGHLGFLSRSGQRFWMVDVALDFVEQVVASRVSASSSR